MNPASSEQKVFPVYHATPPSDEFENAFSSGGSGIVRTCECGRTTFIAQSGEGFDEGELEELINKSNQHPEEYIPVDYTVPTMCFEGSEWVMGCPCNRGGRLEAFINGHDRMIVEYLRSRAKQIKDHAEAIKI